VRSRRSRSYGFVPTIPFMVFILPYVMGRVLIRPRSGREGADREPLIPMGDFGDQPSPHDSQSVRHVRETK
jgi:hypothetical protein